MPTRIRKNWNSSVGRPVFSRKNPLALRAERGLKVILGIGHLVARRSVADLQKNDFLVGAIDQLMCRSAGRKAETHPGREMLLAVVGHQHSLTLEDVDEFVLLAVPVEESR